jgi:pimeloyl-ACP methyl ester carboxylesterase
MAPLAEELSADCGVIEAFQCGYTIEELIGELDSILHKHARPGVILLGHSWGAWLSLLYARHNPSTVEKLILVSSPPFIEELAVSVQETRRERLNREKTACLDGLYRKLETLPPDKRDDIFLDIASIFRQADAYFMDEEKPAETSFSLSRYNAIWNEASNLRSSGELLKQVSGISCPVLAIHGSHDPHPAEGVEVPLAKSIRDFRFILLDKCGHEPWSEKYARNRFYRILRSELRSG